jgi:NADPH-dependent glutamate synthase beta subunit-like oxidoreductase
MASRGRFEEALTKIRKSTPLYVILGRVCQRPCEVVCNRNKLDEPIAINDIKRFVGDYELRNGGRDVEPAKRTKKENVAIIGSGPSGLSAAYDLVRWAMAPQFLRPSCGGGMDGTGYPRIQIAEDILATELRSSRRQEMESNLPARVGRDGITLEDLWDQGYKAIYIAVSAKGREA